MVWLHFLERLLIACTKRHQLFLISAAGQVAKVVAGHAALEQILTNVSANAWMLAPHNPPNK